MQIKRNFFTISELLVASTVLVVILAALTPLALFVSTSNLKARTLADLNAQSLIAQERIKQDLTGTARSEIVMWPSSATSAVCVSFPVLRRDPGETSSPLDANGRIQWNQTVIYHIFYNSLTRNYELRRTVFNPRDNSLNATQRLYQLVYTYAYGTGAQGLYNTQNATTETLLENVTFYRMSSGRAEIDGYSSVHTREIAPLGTWVLNPGYQYYLFRVTGKNDDATGYKIGLDTITLSATGDSYDVEYFLPPYLSYGAVPVAENMSGFSGWSNNSQLLLPSTAVGHYVYLRIHNDMWLETVFNQQTAVLQDAELTFDAGIGENICKMIGNRDTWFASVQTLGALPTKPSTAYENGTVRVALKSRETALGHTIAFRGRRGRVKFSAEPGTGKLAIERAYIMERDTGYNGVAGTVRQLTFADAAAAGTPNVTVYDSNRSVEISSYGTVTSDLFDLAIEPAKEYLVSYHIANAPGKGAPTVWEDATGAIHTYRIAGDSADNSGVADWSGISATSIAQLPRVVGVQSVYCTYPEQALFTSRIVDTRLADPAYTSLTWRDVRTANSALKIRVRAGDMPDLADAPAWSSALELTTPGVAHSLTSLPTGRYIQWQALFSTTAPNTETAKLRDVAVLWPGRRRGIDINVAVEKHTDMGKFELLVNGQQPAPAALNMAFTLRQNVRGQPFERQFAVEAAPRNE